MADEISKQRFEHTASLEGKSDNHHEDSMIKIPSELYPQGSFDSASPSHDSNDSNVCSPERTIENELDRDADSDSSSGGKSQPYPSKSRIKCQDNRRKARRTSSNVFVTRKLEESAISDSGQKLSILHDDKYEEDLKIRNETEKSPLHESLSSSTDENDLHDSITSLPYVINEEPLPSSSGFEDSEEMRKTRKLTAVDGLLFEIYDRFHSRGSSIVESDITECSTTSMNSVYVMSSFENDERLNMEMLETKAIAELEGMIRELKRGINMLSSKLVRLLKQRDRNAQRIQENFNVLTALLQAISQKRRVDTRIRFSFIPRPGKRGFRQWIDALKAVARIRHGIPPTWRKRTWLSLAEYFLKDTDWDRVKKLCFNDRRNPDDDELDTQIVKDLHRTGCGWFFEHDTAEDRASLKRVLLAYARWNKSIGYCQGFNVIAALILQVMEGNEEDALKVMIFLVDYVLPRNYFANNLRALSVDMAVLRDLMMKKLPDLALLLQQLQMEAMDKSANSTASYEPPLINMFTMQWFLTLFATCLPRLTVLRIWDCVLLEGSEVLLRVALAIWAKLGMCFGDNMATASDFYMKMGQLIQDLITDDFINVQKLMQTVYQMAPFPWPFLIELREKYTYDIHPFTTFRTDKKGSTKPVTRPVSDEEEVVDSDDDKMLGCLGFVASSSESSPSKVKQKDVELKRSSVSSKADITKVTPGAYITDQDAQNAYKAQIKESERIREKDLLDVNRLRSQYGRMRRLQQKAMLVFNNDFKDESLRSKNPPSAINHLFVDVNKVAAPRPRYHRKPSNFPALKAPSKGNPLPKPLKENTPKSTKEKPSRIVHENNGIKNTFEKIPTTTADMTPKQNSKDIPESFSITNPYVTREVQATSDMNDVVNNNNNMVVPANSKAADNSDKKTVQSNSQTTTKRTTTSSRPMKVSGKADKDLKSTSLLYQVHKSALYPSNFNPFPYRQNSKRSVPSVK